MQPTNEKYRDSFEKGNANFVLHTLFKGTREHTYNRRHLSRPPSLGRSYLEELK